MSLSRLFLTIIISLFSILSLPTFATSLETEFREGFREVLKELNRTQVQSLGLRKDGTTLKLKMDLADKIDFVEVSDFNKPNGATRNSALAICKPKAKIHKVLINRSAIKTSPVPNVIILHEALGALCVDDPDYHGSMVLALLYDRAKTGKVYLQNEREFWQISNRILNKGHVYAEKLLETYEENSKTRELNTAAYSGGATYIGSAGDEYAALIKLLFLKKYLPHARGTAEGSFKISFLQALYNIRIERKSNIGGSIKFHRTESETGPRKERFYFTVPAKMSANQAASDLTQFMRFYVGYGKNYRQNGRVPSAKKNGP